MPLLLCSLLAMASIALTAPSTNHPRADNLTTASPPRHIAVVLYDSFDLLDVAGVIEPLYLLSSQRPLNLSLIAPHRDAVAMHPAAGERATYPAASRFGIAVMPTHTFSAPPPDIDVLLVPGGGGERLGNITDAINFVRDTYPKVKHLISVCTGAGVAARAGILDGKRATTNKWAWDTVVPYGKNVKWTSPARWVVDGNVWTASGVTSGIDLIFEFMETFYGQQVTQLIQGATEHKRTLDPCDDPFAAWNNVTSQGDCRLTPSLYGKQLSK